jgi:hypothetical protein
LEENWSCAPVVETILANLHRNAVGLKYLVRLKPAAKATKANREIREIREIRENRENK